MNIPKSARLAGKLMRRRGGAATAAHSVASRLVAGEAVAHADPDVARAVDELNEQRRRRLDHVGRSDDRKVRADVEALAELLAWLTDPTDASVHFVSGTVHVFVDHMVPDRSVAKATGRIVVRDRNEELRFWPFRNLRAPPVDGVPTHADMARAAAAAIEVMGFDGTGNRGGVPVWAPPPEVADAIHDGADRESGEVVVRAAKNGEEP